MYSKHRIVAMFCLLVFSFTAVAQTHRAPIEKRLSPLLYYKTELYFEHAVADSKGSFEDEWENFLDLVTERFPGGFVVTDATFQYKQMDDEVIKHPTKIVTLLYPMRARAAANRKIEDIRRAYIKRFKQESVLRMDLPQAVKMYR